MLIVDHNAGFFSCCSVRLEKIIEYYQQKGYFPQSIDGTSQFQWYKPFIPHREQMDISFLYFQPYTNHPQYSGDCSHYVFNNSDPNKPDIQFSCYRKTLDFSILTPIVNMYFQPSVYMENVKHDLQRFYQLGDLSEYCAVFYRGNDKAKEATLPSYDDFIKHIRSLPTHLKLLIQSDETDFIQTMLAEFPDRCHWFSKHVRHMKRDASLSVDHTQWASNCYYSVRFLAIVLLLSQCRYMICTSGNCALWATLFRGSAEGIIQYHDNEWHTA